MGVAATHANVTTAAFSSPVSGSRTTYARNARKMAAVGVDGALGDAVGPQPGGWQREAKAAESTDTAL